MEIAKIKTLIRNKDTGKNCLILTDDELSDLVEALVLYSIKGNAKIKLVQMKDALVKYLGGFI